MIGDISQTGKYIAVTGAPSSNYVNNSNFMGMGQLQYNTNNQQLEVYNGTGWQKLNLGHYYVGLNPDAEQLLDWARKKRDEEQLLESMAKENPAVKIAYDNFQKSRQQLEVTVKLLQDTTEQIPWHPI
jgi:hypothetical protein